jgi:hypothetical protein
VTMHLGLGMLSGEPCHPFFFSRHALPCMMPTAGEKKIGRLWFENCP